MFFKFLAACVTNRGPAEPRLLRIAVPAWRAHGPRSAALPAAPGLSRDEMRWLFRAELNGRPQHRPRLTAWEEAERALAGRIRGALYPAPMDGRAP